MALLFCTACSERETPKREEITDTATGQYAIAPTELSLKEKVNVK